MSDSPSRRQGTKVVLDAAGVTLLGDGSQNFLADRCEIVRRRILRKQPGGHFVDPLIGTLRREDSGDQQLPGAGVVQGAGDVRVHLVEMQKDLLNPRLASGGGLGFCGRSLGSQDDLT